MNAPTIPTAAELAWHFVGDRLRDGRPVPPDGEWLVHDGKIEMCAAGLHASTRIFDALGYAPGGTVCRVAVSGTIKRDTDKLVATKRVILWRLDATDNVMRTFARKAALSVIHLWNAPEIVKRYLETGDETLRDAAWVAAWAAARVAARYAARDAAWDAARYAASAAAWAAAWVAARAAARAAAWDAARSAAIDAARDAAWDAVRDAAWDAARYAAIHKFNAELEALVRAAAGDPDDEALRKAIAGIESK